MKLTVTQTPLSGVYIIETQVFTDERGFFMESWNKKEFAEHGINAAFVQENHSQSKKGVLRGLHYQDMQAPLDKLVRCMKGEIFDVAVDLRKNSATFGKWFGITLSEENKKQLYVPVGFAHGFVTISDSADIEYKQTGYYNLAAYGVIAWNDPDIGIEWPVTNPELVARDQQGMSFKDYSLSPAFE